MTELAGPTKAAIFLLSLEEQRTLKIVEQLTEPEVRKLRNAVDGLGPITRETLDQVYEEFASAFKEGVTPMQDGSRYLQDLVRKAQGEEQAERWFQPSADEERTLPPADTESMLANLSDADPTTLRHSISAEHPQVAAAVLSHLEPTVAAQVLEEMAPDRQIDIVFRIASLRPFPVASFDDAAQGLQGLDLKLGEAQEVDGVLTAASILNEMSGNEANEVLERLSEDHPDDVARLQRAMFTMEDLVEADQRGLQEMLKEVQTDTLLVALKTASDPLRRKLFSCMSKRAASMLEEEAELLPPMRLNEVEAAQDQIVEIAMRLINEGKMSVKGRGEELV